MKLAIAYLVSLLAFVLIDLVWINLVVIDTYRQFVDGWIIERPRLGAAVAFYLVYAAGLVLLAVRPALRENDAAVAWANGALLGGFAYGTYALTNYAMFTDWAFHLVWTDMIWGVVLSSLVSFIGFRVVRPSDVRRAAASTG
ncbi:MAG: DUF2177 family protein [Pseudomonadota bacterium]